MRACCVSLCVYMVNLRCEKCGHDERPVGQPAQSGGVCDFGLYREVSGLAGGVHLACQSVAEP